jgi:hypothetical protein
MKSFGENCRGCAGSASLREHPKLPKKFIQNSQKKDTQNFQDRDTQNGVTGDVLFVI